MRNFIRVIKSIMLLLFKITRPLANKFIAAIHRSAGWSYLRRGVALHDEGKYQDALKDFNHALLLFEKINDYQSQGYALLILSNI